MLHDMVERKDGLLVSRGDVVIMKARDPGLFPNNIQVYFGDKNKVDYNKIEFGMDYVTVRSKNKKSVFDSSLFDYLKDIGRIDCYLSNIPLMGEDGAYYPFFAKYRHGWIVISPVGVT